MKRVFCIGNGESRKGFDLEKLRQHGKIYGCNAIYRDFLPDVLTAVDHGIMHYTHISCRVFVRFLNQNLFYFHHCLYKKLFSFMSFTSL